MPDPLKIDGSAPQQKQRPIVRVGVIGNPRSHRNRGRPRRTRATESMIHWAEPAGLEELREMVEDFRAEGVELIVIDGGDGTVRDVLGMVHAAYGENLPRFGVIPSGKTNALAIDLGVPNHWQVNDAISAHAENRVKTRCAIRLHWSDRNLPDQIGFIFGLGVFSRATALAQSVHNQGLFHGFAVLFTVVLCFFKTLFERGPESWRQGESVRTSLDGEARRLFLVLASTLRRMPAGLKPLGRTRDGLKFLMVDAPPRALYRHALPIVLGKESAAQERAGYHRIDVESLTLETANGIVLDGESYPGGSITLSPTLPIEFVVPARC